MILTGDVGEGDGLPRRCAPRNGSAAALLGRTESSAPTSCHSEPVLTLAWESVSPRLPLRGRCQREALTEGEMPRVFLSPSRLRRQPPPRGGLTARRCRADGTSGRRPLRKMRVAAAVTAGRCGHRPLRNGTGRAHAGGQSRPPPLQRKKRRLPPSLFVQLYCRTTAVTLPSRVA